MNTSNVANIVTGMPREWDPRIAKCIIQLSWHDKFYGSNFEQILKRLWDSSVRLLEEIEKGKAVIDPSKRRALWMIAAHLDSIICLTVPPDFLDREEEKIRTRAYAFGQAYALSKNLSREYGELASLWSFYSELPNIIIAWQWLKKLWISPSSIFHGYAEDFNFDREALEIVNTIRNWARLGWITINPELEKILEPFHLKLVKSK